MKKLWIALAIAALIAVIAVPRVIDYLKEVKTQEEVKRITVETVAVKKGNLVNTIEIAGSISSEAAVNVFAIIPAEVEEIYVKVGDQVEAGDLLFALNAKDIQKQADQAQLGLDSANAAVSQAQLGIDSANMGLSQATLAYEMAKSNYQMNLENYEFAKENLAKYEALYQEGIISEVEYEQMKLSASDETMNLLEQQLKQAEQSLSSAKVGTENAKLAKKQAEVGLSQAQMAYDASMEALGETVYTAPISGYVTSMNLVQQQMASSAMAAVVIEAMDQVIVNTAVTESVVNRLFASQEVTVEIRSIQEMLFKGTIDTLSPSANIRTFLYPMTIKVDNKDLMIKPGMFAVVKAVIEKAEDILYVPKAGVLLRDGKYFVYVAGNETPLLREIVTGLDTGNELEVKEGLAEGDRIITKGIGLITEDTLINEVRGDE